MRERVRKGQTDRQTDIQRYKEREDRERERKNETDRQRETERGR